MPVYPTPHDDPRALARQLSDTRRQLDAVRRRRAGTVADPTPPPAEVEPADLEALLLEDRP